MSYIVYTMSRISVTHATCLLTFTVYKYNELQVSFVTQKLSCKTICKTPFFSQYVVGNPKSQAKNEGNKEPMEKPFTHDGVKT